MARSPNYPARTVAAQYDIGPPVRKRHHEADLALAWPYTEASAEFDHVSAAARPGLATDYDANAQAAFAAYPHPITPTFGHGLAAIDPTNLYGSYPDAHPETFESSFLPDAEQWSPEHHVRLMSLPEHDKHTRAYMALVSPDCSNSSTVDSYPSSPMNQTRRSSEHFSAISSSDPFDPTDNTTEKYSAKQSTRDGHGRNARRKFISGIERHTLNGNDSEATPTQHLSASTLTTPTEERALDFEILSRRNSRDEEGYSASKKPRTDRLARNRVAATKSRAKTQAAAKGLEDDERQARHHHKALVTEEEQLRNQVYLLRNELLLHADCCPSIQRYLSVSAEHIARDAEECASGFCQENRLMSTATEIVSGLHR